jgi:hypothetical protein
MSTPKMEVKIQVWEIGLHAGFQHKCGKYMKPGLPTVNYTSFFSELVIQAVCLSIIFWGSWCIPMLERPFLVKMAMSLFNSWWKWHCVRKYVEWLNTSAMYSLPMLYFSALHKLTLTQMWNRMHFVSISWYCVYKAVVSVILPSHQLLSRDKGGNFISTPLSYICPFQAPLTEPWRWRQHGPPEQYPATSLHSIRTQTTTWIFITVKISHFLSS